MGIFDDSLPTEVGEEIRPEPTTLTLPNAKHITLTTLDLVDIDDHTCQYLGCNDEGDIAFAILNESGAPTDAVLVSTAAVERRFADKSATFRAVRIGPNGNLTVSHVLPSRSISPEPAYSERVAAPADSFDFEESTTSDSPRSATKSADKDTPASPTLRDFLPFP